MSARNEKQRQRVTLRPYFLFYFFVLVGLMSSSLTLWADSHPKPPFTARLMNIEAAANTTFTFNTSLHNTAPVARIFELSAGLPTGWNVSFRVEGSPVTSVNIDSGRTQDIAVEIVPGQDVKPGKYAIPVLAVTGQDSARVGLEAVVKGTYGVTLTTPSGRLSDEITEGKRREIHLVVKNTGTISLDNLDLSGQAPPQWEVSFTPSTIPRLEPGKEQEITASLHVPDKTIAGDYVTNFTVKNPNSTSTAAFRMTVTTSVLTGWLGIVVILAALGVVYYLIRKYGRR